ncbi:hypothetical protein LUZ60_004276 [Juncus effusus]|nr:hypothetical protein LUZ60_004276 [Juncus effusus]
MVEMSIPHLFRCPISLDLFTDPVTLCTGQTYDRYAIEQWLQAGNWTCPVTMQTLQDTSLVPNHTLRHLIEQWLLTGLNPNRQIKKPEPISGHVELSLAAIKQVLQSETATSDSKIDLLKKVRILSVESDVGRACLIQLGFFDLLLQLIFESPLNSPSLYSLELVELSLDCILTLKPSIHLDSLNKILKKDPKFSSLVQLLDQGNAKISTSLCHLIDIIATSALTQELALSIGQLPHVMRSLVSILECKADVASCEASVHAIHALCSLEANRLNAIKEGVINGLIKYLSSNYSTKKNSSPKALAALESLMEVGIGKKTLIKIGNSIQVLVKHVFVISSKNEGSEFAVSVLLVLCRDSVLVRGKMVNAGVLTQLLLLIQSQCSVRAKNKSRALLKLLRLKCRGCDDKL